MIPNHTRPALSLGAVLASLMACGHASRPISPSGAPANTSLVGPAFPLRVSADHRTLIDQRGAAFFIHGDSPWMLVGMVTREDAELYLENRRKHGFNAIITQISDPEIAKDAPKNRYGQSQFKVAQDFSQPNDAYFDHLDWLLRTAESKGLLVLLAPAWLGPSGGIGGWAKTIAANGPAKMRTYGEYLGTRYKDFRNIIWVHGGDWVPPPGSPAEQGLIQLLLGIKARAPDHLHTAHWVRKMTARDNPGVAPYVDIDGFYERVPTYRTAQRAYANPHPLPTFLLEGYYEGAGNYCKGKDCRFAGTRLMGRAQAYWTLLSGAFGHFWSSNHLWGLGWAYEGCDPNWKAHLDDPGTVDMERLKGFFDRCRTVELVPDLDHSVMTDGLGSFASDDYTVGDYATAARTADGKLFVAYLPTKRTVTIDTSKLAGSVSAHWYDPTSASWLPAEGVPNENRGTQKFTPPDRNRDGDSDFVLVLETAGGACVR